MIGRWDAFRREMLLFMSDYDALLCPVCSFAGMEHGSTYDRLPSFSYTMTFQPDRLAGRSGARRNDSKGLPIGVQIVARPWREDVALALAQVLQDSLGGFQPPGKQ